MSAALVPRGLPGPLPEGETVLWQGAPRVAALMRHGLHARLVVAYFAGAAVLAALAAWAQGRTLGSAAVSVGLIGAGLLAVLGLIRLLAILIARTTLYTITTRRVVMQIGIALPVTLNIPFGIVEGAGLKTNPDGTGDIPLTLGGDGRIGILHLWPHARPWRLSRPEPMLRAVPDAAQVAAILARAAGTGPLGRAAAARQDATARTARRAVAAA